MRKSNRSSRRSFLTKMAVGTVGMVLSSTMGASAIVPQRDTEELHPQNNCFDSLTSYKKFVPVMLTPYQQNGLIDFEGFSSLIDFYLAAGVKGFFANCLSSEMYHLTEEERLAITRHVVKRVNGTVPVVATGSFGETIDQKAAFAKSIYHTGISAVINITSHFAKMEENDDVLIKNFEQFFTLTDNIPMGTYECPSPYKRILSPKVFSYLLSTNRMLYHKDTTIDFEKVKAKIELCKNNKLEFYDACVANTVSSLQAGAKGMSAISGNFYPEILVWMCTNANNPAKQDDVNYIQAQLTKTEDIISENYSLSAKYFLRKRGLPIALNSRASANPLTTKQKEALDNTYQQLLGWCNRIGIEPTRI